MAEINEPIFPDQIWIVAGMSYPMSDFLQSVAKDIEFEEIAESDENLQD